ncbi:iron permease FTR1 [Metschnikowia bicuspidata]|uniref:Iron permease FTR1 n=1 Tax=Metschnikowia bicuspidata TaxID=27322 RepID=A0A4P9ZEA2_9ASCO|nr:iron permease FTR1 [Metschnikowia bicuspidata]
MLDVSKYFSFQVFFIILRETLETAIIISVLLSFINKQDPGGDPALDTQEARHRRSANRNLRIEVFLGAAAGFLVCLLVGAAFIACFYLVEKDIWAYTERLWEGVFCLLSSGIITVMGVGLLRINKIMKVKWWIKLGDAYAAKDDADAASTLLPDALLSRVSLLSTLGLLDEQPPRSRAFRKKYFLAILPFVTTLREGMEAVVFVGGVGIAQPPQSIPSAVVAGMALGAAIGYSLYRGGNKLSLQYFLIVSTCFLYVVSAGLISRGVWFLELERFVQLCGLTEVSEAGSGPGSYDVANSVWHVNCCDGLHDGWWMVANALVGWTNSATYGSVLSYIVYWALVSAWLRVRLIEERRGYLPFIPLHWQIKRIRKKLRLYEAGLAHITLDAPDGVRLEAVWESQSAAIL